jgi:hypothetical protein
VKYSGFILKERKMNKFLSLSTYGSSFLLLFIALVSCSGTGSDTVGGGAVGLLSIGLTDAPPERNMYEGIYVTIEEVQVKHANKAGWDILSGPDLNLPQTFNLLDLKDGAIADLGAVELTTGHYNQMRLILGTEPVGKQHNFANYLILKDDVENPIPLKVPSGNQTGIKLVSGFDIEVEGSTDLVLDFDARKSIVQAGNSGNWHLKPTIKVIESVVNSVSGMIDDENGDPVEGALLSAQLYTPPDEVEGVNETFSNGDGLYFMYLPLNGTSTPYNIVATATETSEDNTDVVYEPACHVLDSTDTKAYTVNFVLTPAAVTGMLSGTIDGLPEPGIEDDYYVYLSIRQLVDCDGIDGLETMVEVEYRKIANVAGGAISYGPIALPVGEEYEIVAWTDGAGTLDPTSIDVVEGDNVRDIDFPPAP